MPNCKKGCQVISLVHKRGLLKRKKPKLQENERSWGSGIPQQASAVSGLGSSETIEERQLQGGKNKSEGPASEFPKVRLRIFTSLEKKKYLQRGRRQESNKA